MENKSTVNFLDILPYYSIEDDLLIFKDGRVAIGFSIEPIQYEILSEEEYQTLSSKFQSIINSAPDNLNITFYNVFYHDNNEALNSLDDTFLQSKAKKHFERPMLHHKIYLFVSFDNDKTVNASTTILARKGNIQLADFKHLKDKKENLLSYSNEITGLLSINDITFSRLDENQLSNFIWQYVNLDFTKDYDDLYAEIHNQHNTLIIGDRFLNILTLEGQGENINYCKDYKYSSGESVVNPYVSDIGINLTIPHILVQSFRKVNKDKALGIYDKELLFNKNLPDLPMFKKSHLRSGQLEDFLNEIRQSDNSLVEYALHILVHSNDSKELSKQIEMSKKAINNLDLSKAVIESFDNASIFFGCMPGNSGQLFRNILVPSDVASTQLHLVSNYISDTRGDFFCDRFGNMILVDMFHDELKAKNKLVIGPTGSGKSFVEGHLISLAKERGELQVIIDKGGTYKNLVNIHNGLYFEHTEANPLHFNPFIIDKDKEGDWKIDNDKVVFLKTLLSILWKSRSDNEIFSKAEGAVLARMIPAYYEFENEQRHLDKEAVPNLGRFVNFIKKYHEENKDDEEYKKQAPYFDIDQFILVLEPFTHGIYKEIFNNDSTENLSEADLICFDLDAIQKDATLYPIISMLIIELVLDHIRKFPDKIKHVIFDEAWSMFTGEMGEFIVYMYRTIRKQNGEISVITQSAMDLDDSALGQVLKSNTEVLVILNHEGKDFNALQDSLQLSDLEIQKIKSLRRDKTARELFIRRGVLDSKVYSLEVPIEEYAILTTMPREKNHFNRLLKQHGSLNRAVYEFVHDFKSNAIKAS